MSEYWKSTPKYWCKHCSAYIRDTAFEKRQHEATAKHQNNLKRFLRDIQNNHEHDEREKEKAKAEVERLNKVVGSAGPTATSSVASKPPATVRKTPAAPLTATDQKRQWTQLAEMGIEVPDNHRAEMAMAGDWKVVSQATPKDNNAAQIDSLSVGVHKRKLDEQEQEDLESGTSPSARRVWGKSVRTYPGEDIQDLDNLLSGTIALKEKKEEDVKREPATAAQASLAPNASPVAGFPADDASLEASANAALAKQEPNVDSTPLVKPEFAADGPETARLNQIPEDTPIPVFKRRKAKTTSAK
ncbi:uncharacterized protein HMPREF1541_08761 [Cyphellophora europaea CBS 101466]|uniref:U1-type domain-containing protein n=1 Tax=Cyphellophora europaea (strain CBS 101466) TaxID=1220924 RepID=W2RLA3_CYPE1|nr:uncharacterized protein HMPREF1541_08761 [Cyphellophora europaea CBS 101466]ETN36483.1 hypothetical protein HMPREF1541_08761 [Cyphellophora europaea CBS 101466]